jgi:ACS family tartrate transporter-like MFS transporter
VKGSHGFLEPNRGAKAFWALTTTLLSGIAAADRIALINSVGNLGGFVGPTSMGVMKDKSGGDSGGLIVLGLCYLTVVGLAFAIPKNLAGRTAPTS